MVRLPEEWRNLEREVPKKNGSDDRTFYFSRVMSAFLALVFDFFGK